MITLFIVRFLCSLSIKNVFYNIGDSILGYNKFLVLAQLFLHDSIFSGWTEKSDWALPGLGHYFKK